MRRLAVLLREGRFTRRGSRYGGRRAEGSCACRAAKLPRTQMEEHGTAFAARPLPFIVAKYHHNVVDRILAPKYFMARGVGPRDKPVVIAVGRIVAPAVCLTHHPGRERGIRHARTTWSPQHPAEWPDAARGHPIAFDLAPGSAIVSEPTGNRQAPSNQDAAG
jgi:hypothetical protein